jgi:hypothetical protein
MSKLTKNIRRSNQYQIGGVAVLIGIDTFENGKNTLVVTPGTAGADGTVALATGITSKPVVIEFEEGGDNVCSFNDNTAFGTNTYLVPTVGFKISGRSNALNEVMKAFDLGRTSFAIKTKTGEYLVVGAKNGLKATQNNSGGDGTPAGFFGYDLVMTGGEIERSTSITEASFESLLGQIPTDV